MKKIFFWIFLLSSIIKVNAQVNPSNSLYKGKGVKKSTSSVSSDNNTEGSSKENQKKPKAKIEDYQIISFENDTTYVDTTLSIQKEYKFNYLRKDNFGLLPFSNIGQTYNSLTYDFDNTSLMPSFGAQARHFNYMSISDISYYNAPTPLTELFYKTAFEQGQLADSFFTANTSPQFNFSIAYKGLRSLGKYQHLLTSTGNFRFTFNYNTKNKRYYLRGHIVMQDLFNQENGGLKDGSVQNFIEGDDVFLDRSLLEVNFVDAESILLGKRFFLDHSYNMLKAADSVSNNKISIGHVIYFEDKFFEYNQANATSYFGESFKNSGIKDRTTLEHFYNQVHLNYSNNLLGILQINVSSNNYNYGYDKVVVVKDQILTNRLKGDVMSVGAKYSKRYKGFDLLGETGLNVSGAFQGNFLKAQAGLKLGKDAQANVSLNISAKAPNYNFLLNHSDYSSYNWQTKFNNTESQQLQFELKSNTIANLCVDYSTISDYTYFKVDELINQVRPFQYDKTINYLRVKLQREIKLGRFALDNTLLYQNITNGNDVLNVPVFTSRNALYYSNHAFNKAMYFQTGFILNYFTEYYMNAYNPILSEFYVQNEKKLGAFPRLDFFVNAKIRQARIFLKAEHFNSSFTGYDYFAAPNVPYRDFAVRFGLIWDFFL